jgi:hypothetical protein
MESDACVMRPVTEVIEANIIAEILSLTRTCRKLYTGPWHQLDGATVVVNDQ